MSIELEKTAPAFTLEDSGGEPTSLKDLRGNWAVLYFYPRDDTPGCTAEACEFTDAIDDFARLDACVVGISPDAPERHRFFIEKYGLRVRLLSDPSHEVLERYGAWGTKRMYGRESEGVIRSTVLIDPQGRVAKHWPKVRAKGHAAEVRSALAELAG